ncbi:hypothetical protein V1971_32680, partial [Pseudomonas aeruginosa]
MARWPWNAWPDERGLGGRMAWNPQFALIFLILLFAVAWFSSSELRSHAVPWLIHWFEVLNR